MNNFDLLGKQVGEIDNLVESWIEQIGLTHNHFAVLYTLANSENGQCTQKQICEEWYLPKQTVFNICKEYREKGWIEFFESPTDKREKIMRLTDLGKIQAEPVLAQTNVMCDNAFKAFGQEKTQQLFALMSEFCQVCRGEMDKLK
ncbi:MarR family transcriptional regulator [Pasteurellaceae bacterium 15-036681]|nr:MarR family transcriptional regulator [Pasteurellaceae bacterium 15-036681]